MFKVGMEIVTMYKTGTGKGDISPLSMGRSKNPRHWCRTVITKIGRKWITVDDGTVNGWKMTPLSSTDFGPCVVEIDQAKQLYLDSLNFYNTNSKKQIAKFVNEL